MKNGIIFLAIVLFFICWPIYVHAQKDKAEKARNISKKRTPKQKAPPSPKTWTLMNQEGTAIHQKLRFTFGDCQKVESWTYVFGGAEKLTVQAGKPNAVNCPAFAQWENAPLSSLKAPGFNLSGQMEFSSEEERKVRKLTLHEGWLAIGGLIGNKIRRDPSGLHRILEDFRFEVLYPQMLKETKSLDVSLRLHQGF